jgi:hypothetical protein
MGYRAEPSGHEMTAFDVYVDEPGQDVVLALGAYDPATGTYGSHVQRASLVSLSRATTKAY